MKQIQSNGIKQHSTEPYNHQQNHTEGVIREMRRHWFQIMVQKRVHRKVWDSGMKWVIETMPMTRTSSGGIYGSIPITNVAGETADIYEYLDFGFYDKIWYLNNAGL